jgi:2-oxoglutarate-Fe(II)-dependent oxygenase superfamily protein
MIGPPVPIRRLDLDALHREFSGAEPFPFVKIDEFLEPAFADDVADSMPTFEEALALGRNFETVNEHLKVQICRPETFAAPVRRLHDELASPAFLDALSRITGIPGLLADDALVGGGIHETGPGGRLDVHVDFNYVPDRNVFRRLNLLLYLNKVWEDSWGGHVELWDPDVKTRRQAFAPVHNRCVIFATGDTSFHGVTTVRCPEGTARKSFSAYYYTREAPPGFADNFHGTVFRARPQEKFKGRVLMPLEAMRIKLAGKWRELQRKRTPRT